MTNKDLKEFLIDIANTEMSGDPFAWVIATYLGKINIDGDKEKFYDSLVNFYKQHRENKALPMIKLPEKETTTEDDNSNSDYRIKSIRIANVRGIKDVDEDGYLFGFNLSEGNTIKNAVILGPNSVGKSSIYSAIEYIYGRTIGETKLRDAENIEVDDDKFREYLQRYKNGFNNSKCFIDTPSGCYSFKNYMFTESTRRKINPHSHFISDYEIYRNGRLNYKGIPTDASSFHLLIANSLGFQEFLDFNSLISSFSKYKRLKEKKQLNAYLNEKLQHETERKNWEMEIDNRKRQIDELNKSNVDNQLPIQNNSKKMNNILSDILNQAFLYDNKNEKLFNVIDSYNISFTKFIANNVDELINVEFDFLTLGKDLTLNRNLNNCPFCLSSRKEIDVIISEVENRLKELITLNGLRKNVGESYVEIVTELKTFLFKIIQRKIYFENVYNDILNIPELYELSRILSDYLQKNISFIEDEIINQIKELNPEKRTLKELFNFHQVTSDKNSKLLLLINEIENYNYNIFTKINTLINDIQKSILPQDEITTAAQKIAVMSSEITKYDQQIMNSIKRIETLEYEIKNLNSTISLFEEMQIKANQYFKILNNLINKSVSESLEPIEGTLREILSGYLQKEEDIELVITREQKLISKDDEIPTDVIIAKLNKTDTTTGEIITLTPNEYFNTFRYKLFCMLVSCSIAIASRMKTGINIPLVFDDIFYASDYLSKAKFIDFLNSLIRIFKKYTPSLPFQFIMFTHDDMIFQTAMDAFDIYEEKISDSDLTETEEPLKKEVGSSPKSLTIFGRLFKPEDRDDSPKELYDGNKYWDMLYTLPKRISINEIISQPKFD